MIAAVLLRAVAAWAVLFVAFASWVLWAWRKEAQLDREIIDEQLRQQGSFRRPYESDSDALQRAQWLATRRIDVDFSRWVDESGIVNVGEDVDQDATTRRAR